MKGMSLFSKKEKEDFNDLEAAYRKELREAGADYNAVKAVQEKYADVFDKSAQSIADKHPGDEEVDDAYHTDRIYLNENNKKLIMDSYKNTHGNNMKHMPNKGLCQVCGERFSGLGVYSVQDSVEICMDDATEENYIDFNNIILCKFGG